MSFGVTELVIILVIVVLLFGTTKIKTQASDHPSANKTFTSAVTDDSEKEAPVEAQVEKKTSESADS